MPISNDITDEYLKNVEYAIYVRKSTEESSNKQVQSIPTQIIACLKYAENSGLKIMEMPEKHREFFESSKGRTTDASEENTIYKELMENNKHLFIISEQETGKEPYKRKKWRKLIELVKDWKVRGILSYSPDRQSRNMLEWGEIIDFTDQGILDLKYTNFHFEPNASWKMMLGIWFVFSKQYSDKLQEDTIRWMNHTFNQGKSLGYKKHWYKINKNDYHEPDPETFPLIREAFEMKMYARKTDVEIVEHLKRHWYSRKFKDGSKNEISKDSIAVMWRDTFYSWINTYNNLELVLSSENPYFKPMISGEEVALLESVLYGDNRKRKDDSEQEKDEYTEIRPFPSWMVLTETNDEMNWMLPVPHRYKNKVTAGEVKNLSEAVSPHQMSYRCMKKDSPNKGLSIKADKLIDKVLNFFENINPSEEDYKKYVEFVKSNIDADSDIKAKKKKNITLRISQVEAEKKNFIKKNLGIDRDSAEKQVYEEEKRRYDMTISGLKEEIEELEKWDKESLEAHESFFDILKNLSYYYHLWSYVQKRQLAEIFLLNIKISPIWLTIEPKPEMKDMFVLKWLPE